MIYRTDKKTDYYTRISKSVLEDDRLSFKEKGILAYLLSKPDNWNAYISQLKTVGPDGRTSISNAVKNLEIYGYLKRQEVRENGKIKRIIVHVYEKPCSKADISLV